jgi:hypothetical protein
VKKGSVCDKSCDDPSLMCIAPQRFETVIVGSSQPQLMLKILDMRMSKLTDSEELMQVWTVWI